MSIFPFPWMRRATHQKTMVAIVAFGLAGCAGDDETVEEPITAADIHAIESDTTESDWALTEDNAGEESSFVEGDSFSSEESAATREDQSFIEDFEPLADSSAGDWTGAPSDPTDNSEPASFVSDTADSSDSFITSMTDVAEIEKTFHVEADGRYVVQPGDSLSKIAAKIYGSSARWREIADVNGIAGGFVIHPGDTVKFATDTEPAHAYAERFEALPRGVVTVQKGDSLSKIASRIYGKANYWKVLMSLNRDVITSPNKIFVGAKLQYVKPQALNTFASGSVSDENALAQE